VAAGGIHWVAARECPRAMQLLVVLS
jgi:hypothetical protein